MEAKVFELRDRGTLIPLLAVKASPFPSRRESWLLRRSGRSPEDVVAGSILVIGSLETGKYGHDPSGFGGARTFPLAHKYIMDNWADLQNGQVICIEHILGEREAQKETEQEGGVW
jgi:hypothetical protein